MLQIATYELQRFGYTSNTCKSSHILQMVDRFAVSIEASNTNNNDNVDCNDDIDSILQLYIKKFQYVAYECLLTKGYNTTINAKNNVLYLLSNGKYNLHNVKHCKLALWNFSKSQASFHVYFVASQTNLISFYRENNYHFLKMLKSIGSILRYSLLV